MQICIHLTVLCQSTAVILLIGPVDASGPKDTSDGKSQG